MNATPAPQKEPGWVPVTFHNDTNGSTQQETVSAALADLFAYAHQWALADQQQTGRTREPTLTFSSMLAAMISGSDPLCGWLVRHLDLRGVSSSSISKARTIAATSLPSKLTTTLSFRQAFDQARSLMQHAQTAGGIEVRHFMAAYAVVPRYHLKDFLKYRIDRRAWCLALAEYLAAEIPGEKRLWVYYASLAPPVPVMGFESDAPEGPDLLNIGREVEAFSTLIASRRTVTPLSIGVFGQWGSGKSFFMRRVRERVAAIAAKGRDEKQASRYHGQIAQIEFNAWHYSEGNLVASLVDHIFRNLRFNAGDETEEVLRQRRVDVLKKIEAAEQIVAASQEKADQAASRVEAAKQKVEQIDARIQAEIAAKTSELAGAQTKLQDAQNKVRGEIEQMETEIREAVARVPARSVFDLLTEKLLGDPALAVAGKDIRGLVADARRTAGRGKQVFWGLSVLAVMALAAAIAQTGAWVQITSAAAAIAGFAGVARTWLKKLNEIADRGEQFQKKQAELAAQVTAEVTRAHEESLNALKTVAAGRLGAVQALQNEVTELQKAPEAARLEIKGLEKERADAVSLHAKAEAEAESQRRALESLNAGRLLDEMLTDYASTSDYRKELTIFSRVRNHFERLSKVMAAATEDYYDGKPGAEAPAVSRIVLYIDDLDRCPAARVIDVLRVVHLLLAFPLFVCVVAVDPRWLTECLQQAPGVKDATGDLLGQMRASGPAATPADYLEKIFQIPLWLRPIPAAQRPAVVRAFLGAAETRPLVRREAQQVSAGDFLALEQPAAGPEDADVETTREDIDAAELKYLDALSHLLEGNPRTLKRFVNTYQLVKTALSEAEFKVFLATPGDMSYKPYQFCMAQLAVLCTQRPRALLMVRHADGAEGKTSIEGWLESLAAKDAGLAECLSKALSETGDLKSLDFATFNQWLERTRRYSFYL
jgi:hypothetical protein